MADYRDYEAEARREERRNIARLEEEESKRNENFAGLLRFLLDHPDALEELRSVLNGSTAPDVVE